jgi:hypothetical protein
MSYTSKSPVDVARVALAVAADALPANVHRFSPRKFTQPQLFACLVLKAFFKTDYRGIAIYLEDLPDLAALLGLKTVPHWTTLQKASKRLLSLPAADRLLSSTVERFLGGKQRLERVAFDSTGLSCGHASSYYIRRRAKGGKTWQNTTYKHFAKLEAAFDCDSHLIVGAIPRRGPRVDVDRFVPLLEQVLKRVRPKTVLADAGYDSEPNHRHAREARGAFGDPGGDRSAQRQAAAWPLASPDEGAAGQELQPVRATLAGGDGVLDDQAPPRFGGRRPQLLGPVPRADAVGRRA